MTAIDTHWAKMPCSWQTDRHRYAALSAHGQGAAISGMKIYLAACLRANFYPNARFASAGCVQKSITDFSEMLHLSRPMIIDGIRALKAVHLLEPLVGRPTIYRIADYDSAPYWAKLPKRHLLGNRPPLIAKLSGISARGRTALHALQLYLYLAAIHDKKTDVAKVAYPTISDVLHAERSEVSRAISILVEWEMITVRRSEEDEGPADPHPTNKYRLIGFPAKKAGRQEPTGGINADDL